METIENQHQQVLWYLINRNKVALMDVIKDSMFFKFQTRLSELESEHGNLTIKVRKKFTNRFGRESSFLEYTALDKEQLKKLLKEMQK